ncbi:MAG: hypothetical protein IPM56_19010 [Ignavibacteriales bacterium]|nr:MAG: hypothetical protein IPM56_19010 [Ignavibacteriales bacterium]
MNNDELKYKDVIDGLKNLKKVETPKDFETTLMRKLNQPEKIKKESIFKRLFIPSRLVPSMALAVTAVILVFVIDLSPDELENPLLLEPRLRQDIVMVTSEEPVTVEKQVEKKSKDAPKKEEAPVNTLPSVQEMMKDEVVIQNQAVMRNEADLSATRTDSFANSPAVTGSVEAIQQPVQTSIQNEIDKSGLDYRQINLNVEDRQNVQKLKERMQNSVKKGDK